MKEIDKKELAKQLKESADYLAEHREEGGCYRFHTVKVKDKNVSIVLGWLNGFDKNENDEYADGSFHLCAKVGYQSVNNAMQCDYDIDFSEVCYKNTGEVFDTEVVLYPDSNFESIAEFLIEDFKHILLNWNNFEHE